MNLELAGKVAIVGGASQGIGFGIARTLASEGANVVITARREDKLAEAAGRIRAACGSEVRYVASDVRSAEDCKTVVAAAVAEFGAVDVLVNNDGAPPLGALESFDDASWEKAVTQNMMSVIRMVREVLPHMRKRGAGSIINITALSAIQPINGFGLSVATWAGVIGYAKTLSNELGPDNIRVNTICPGYIETPRLQRSMAQGGEPDAVRQKRAAQTALGRIGAVEEVANVVTFLASARASYVTGTTIQIDGGMFKAVR